MVKLKATTILETTIAMVIIVAIFLTAMSIFLNISKEGVTARKIAAYESINTYLDSLEINAVPAHLTTEINGTVIETSIEQYEQQPELAIVTCDAYNDQHVVIGEQKRIIKVTK